MIELWHFEKYMEFLFVFKSLAYHVVINLKAYDW